MRNTTAPSSSASKYSTPPAISGASSFPTNASPPRFLPIFLLDFLLNFTLSSRAQRGIRSSQFVRHRHPLSILDLSPVLCIGAILPEKPGPLGPLIQPGVWLHVLRAREVSDGFDA